MAKKQRHNLHIFRWKWIILKVGRTSPGLPYGVEKWAVGGGEIENFQLKMSEIGQFLAKLFNFGNFRLNCSNSSRIGQIWVKIGTAPIWAKIVVFEILQILQIFANVDPFLGGGSYVKEGGVRWRKGRCTVVEGAVYGGGEVFLSEVCYHHYCFTWCLQLRPILDTK